MKKDVNLFFKLLIISKSHSDFDLKSIVSKLKYKITAVSRSLYLQVSDGEMQHCLKKNKLMHFLENMVETTHADFNNGLEPTSNPTSYERTFDGNMSWTNYPKQIETVAKTNEWSEKEKTIHLTRAFEGDALDVLQAIPVKKTWFWTT